MPEAVLYNKGNKLHARAGGGRTYCGRRLEYGRFKYVSKRPDCEVCIKAFRTREGK